MNNDISLQKLPLLDAKESAPNSALRKRVLLGGTPNKGTAINLILAEQSSMDSVNDKKNKSALDLSQSAAILNVPGGHQPVVGALLNNNQVT